MTVGSAARHQAPLAYPTTLWARRQWRSRAWRDANLCFQADGAAPHDVANHADIQTTMRYLHYAPRDEDAALVAEAFAVAQPAEGAAHSPQ